ncbi:MAG: hypothetical protein QXF76_03330 [Candidatus Anstonellales archaeon]
MFDEKEIAILQLHLDTHNLKELLPSLDDFQAVLLHEKQFSYLTKEEVEVLFAYYMDLKNLGIFKSFLVFLSCALNNKRNFDSIIKETKALIDGTKSSNYRFYIIIYQYQLSRLIDFLNAKELTYNIISINSEFEKSRFEKFAIFFLEFL